MKPIPFLLTVCGVIAVGWASYANYLRGTSANKDNREPVVHLAFDSTKIDHAILVSERAVRIDPQAAMGWSILSSDYMARSRESDDLTTAVKAEAAARKSLAIRVLGNIGARNKLAQSLLQQHRFKDALEVCNEALAAKIYDDSTIRIRAESLIEIGRYDEAHKVIALNARAFQSGSGQAIESRLRDVDGKPMEALQLMQSAMRQADQAPAMPSDAIAWFHTRVAIQLAKMGRHSESQAEYERALVLYPRDYKAMAGLARLAFDDGKYQGAIDWGNRSDEVAQMADVRALVGDAYALMGEPTKAEEQYTRVATLVGRPSGMNDGLHEVAPSAGTHGHRLDRQYALFCADHNRDPDGAYAAALRDFEGRHDIYAFDTLAWVCRQTGKNEEAVKAIEKALERGTQDPVLLYHAGAIYATAGRTAKANEYLKRALAIDPEFDAVQARQAEKLLVSLATGNRV